jgi:hypothetical protein
LCAYLTKPPKSAKSAQTVENRAQTVVHFLGFKPKEPFRLPVLKKKVDRRPLMSFLYLFFYAVIGSFLNYKQAVTVCPISVSFETVYAAETLHTKLRNY